MLAIRTLHRLRPDKRGATAIEYGLIAALIAVAIISALQTLGSGNGGMWGKLDSKIDEAMN